MLFFPAQIYKGPQNNVLFLEGSLFFPLLSLLGFAYLTGFWMEISIKHLKMSLSFLLVCFTYLSSLVFKLSNSFQKSVHTFFTKSLIQKY